MANSDLDSRGVRRRIKVLVRWCQAVVIMVLTVFAAVTPANAQTILLQSTTSTQNSGLLDAILPQFTHATGIAVRVVAVGTGQAIRNARNGDADVLLVHAKAAEEQFVADGFAARRHDLMYNDFVIVGPASDLAATSGERDVVAALKKIAAAAIPFASRGDDSGTHKKEQALWKQTGINPAQTQFKWYRETGSGMGATLNIAVGMGAYVMTDRATWIVFGNKGNFEIHVQGDPKMFNQYGVMAISEKKHPHVKATAAAQLVQWLTGSVGQSAIATYQRDAQQLFFPNAKP